MERLVVVIGLIILSGCQAPLALIPARQQDTQKITLGAAQKSLVKGTSASDVIEVMGSPNIVTLNIEGSETWVYDKIATESEFAEGRSSGVVVTSTRALIVIIRFNTKKVIEDVKYRQTSY